MGPMTGAIHPGQVPDDLAPAPLKINIVGAVAQDL